MKCPKCGSLNVIKLGKMERSMLEILIKPNEKKYTFQCKKCGNAWVDIER